MSYSHRKCLLSKDTAVPLLGTVTSVFLSWSVLAGLKGAETVFKKKKSQSNCWLHSTCVPFPLLLLRTVSTHITTACGLQLEFAATLLAEAKRF